MLLNSSYVLFMFFRHITASTALDFYTFGEVGKVSRVLGSGAPSFYDLRVMTTSVLITSPQL